VGGWKKGGTQTGTTAEEVSGGERKVKREGRQIKNGGGILCRFLSSPALIRIKKNKRGKKVKTSVEGKVMEKATKKKVNYP